jgi:hypothetical protein
MTPTPALDAVLHDVQVVIRQTAHQHPIATVLILLFLGFVLLALVERR